MTNVKENSVLAGFVLTSTTPVKLNDKAVEVRNSVVLVGDSGNTTDVLVGDQASQTIHLSALGTLTLRFVRLNDIWVKAASATPTVNWIASGVIL
jgi:hypothetical protein